MIFPVSGEGFIAALILPRRQCRARHLGIRLYLYPLHNQARAARPTVT